jgi:hypothetical protein
MTDSYGRVIDIPLLKLHHDRAVPSTCMYDSLPICNSCYALQVIGRIMSRKEALSQFIQQIHGRPVVVKLNSGVDYRGKTFKI